MRKELKEKLIKHNEEMRAAFPSLYNNRWVEKAADEGWKQLRKDLEKIDPKLVTPIFKNGGNIFEVVYYSAFENALNTFFMECLDDAITNIKLCVDELHKLSAEITTKEDQS